MKELLDKAAGWMLPITALTTVVAAALASLSNQRAQERIERVSAAVDELQYSLTGLRDVGVMPVAERAKTGLPDGADIPGTLRDIEQLAVGHQIELTTLEMTSATSMGSRSFVIRGRSSPTALCDLLAGIEAHQRLMILDEGVVQAATNELVQFGFTVTTYQSQEDVR